MIRKNPDPKLTALLLGFLVALVPVISESQQSQQSRQSEERQQSDKRQQSDNFFSDSQRERDPAITAFPKYPYVARRDRMEGEATVCFTVNARGQIIRPSIRSSSHKIFERPAMKAIRESTFDPLKPGETKSNLKTCRIYRFRLAPILASSDKSGN